MTIIKPNTFSRRGTEFFKDFIPYQLDSGFVGTDKVEEMISYTLIPSQQPVVINQVFGAENTFSFSMELKNLTTNTNLSVELESDNYFIISPVTVFLRPNERRRIKVSADNSVLNQNINERSFLTEIKLKVTNQKNGLFAIKRVDVQSLNQTSLPRSVDIE